MSDRRDVRADDIETLERADALLSQLEPIQYSDSDAATVAACRDVRRRLMAIVARLKGGAT